jgi:hypothetical protein
MRFTQTAVQQNGQKKSRHMDGIYKIEISLLYQHLSGRYAGALLKAHKVDSALKS